MDSSVLVSNFPKNNTTLYHCALANASAQYFKSLTRTTKINKEEKLTTHLSGLKWCRHPSYYCKIRLLEKLTMATCFFFPQLKSNLQFGHKVVCDCFQAKKFKTYPPSSEQNNTQLSENTQQPEEPQMQSGAHCTVTILMNKKREKLSPSQK